MAIPSDISGLLVWFKADGTLWQDSGRTTPATADGDPVGSWDDASGNSNHAQQATSGSRPLLKTGILNSKPLLRFDGTDDYLACLSSAATKQWFVVAKYPHTTFVDDGAALITGVDSGEGYVLNGEVATDHWFNLSGTGDNVYRRQGVDLTSSPTGPMDAFYYMSHSDTGGWTITPQFGLDRDLAFLGATRFGDYDIAEVFAFDSVLGSTDLAAMEAYLDAKYFTAAVRRFLLVRN